MSVLGPGTRVTGRVQGRGGLAVAGRVQGDIRVAGPCQVAAGAVVEGDVAAESLDRKAFYVALSRGRQQMSLHCPDKEHLKSNLARRTGERVSVHDLIRDREIPANAVLPLSEKARKQKAAILPDIRNICLAMLPFHRIKRFQIVVLLKIRDKILPVTTAYL